MQQIEITTLSGHSPYNITMCDITKTYCYPVLSGVVGAPPTLTLNVPTQLEGTQELLVVVTDAAGCNTFHLYTCYTPTPTPTMTPTPTPTMVVNCNCISFELSLLSRRQIVESYLQLPELTGYGYVIVPASMRQPDTFRNSVSECSEYIVPMINQGEIIININGINAIYNVYRTFVTTSAYVDIWICN